MYLDPCTVKLLVKLILVIQQHSVSLLRIHIWDHMARTAPSYLFINRRGAIDWNLCLCYVSEIIARLSSKALVN